MEANNKGKLIKILSRSYVFYFALFLIGILIDLRFPTAYLKGGYALYLGLFFIVFSTFLIFWIKKNSKNAKKENLTKEDFMKGPYRYTSIPNHWAIFFLLLGFAVLINASITIVLTILAYFVTLPSFLKMQEKVLIEKFGEPYRKYKEIVRH